MYEIVYIVCTARAGATSVANEKTTERNNMTNVGLQLVCARSISFLPEITDSFEHIVQLMIRPVCAQHNIFSPETKFSGQILKLKV